MNNLKSIVAATLAVASMAMAGAAQAEIKTFTFTGFDGARELTATLALDVVGGFAVSGGGTLQGPDWSGSDALTLVTLSTPGVNDLGGGALSYRFGGGTDLIGDTSLPISSNGLVFQVSSIPDQHLGFNIWSNGDGSFTGFLGGDATYEGFNGRLAAGGVPEPETWALLIAGAAMIGFATRRQRAARPLAA
jgi:PEP-CTERM motif-containing protein